MPPSRDPKEAQTPSEGVISRQLRQMLRDRGGSMEALGRESGVDPSQLRRFLSGERDIKVETLDRLADVLGLRLIEGARGKVRPAAPTRAKRAVRVERPAPTALEAEAEPVE